MSIRRELFFGEQHDTTLAVQIVKSQRGISRFGNTYKADYDDFFIVSSDAAREQLEKAAEVIGIVEAHL